MTIYFTDRSEAGRELAKALSPFKEMENTVVLALSRGGVPVAHEVSRALCLPLELMSVRKPRVPGEKKLAMNVTVQGGRVPGKDSTRGYNASLYDGKPLASDLNRCTVILVDDGMATGADMWAAVEFVRQQHAGQIVVAIPVSSEKAYDHLSEIADKVVCLHLPRPFHGVSAAYNNFAQPDDEDAITGVERGGESTKDSKSLQYAS